MFYLSILLTTFQAWRKEKNWSSEKDFLCVNAVANCKQKAIMILFKKNLRLKRRISQYEHQIFELALRPPKNPAGKWRGVRDADRSRWLWWVDSLKEHRKLHKKGLGKRVSFYSVWFFFHVRTNLVHDEPWWTRWEEFHVSCVRGSAGREGSNPLASCGGREERGLCVWPSATSTFSLENEKGINLNIYLKKTKLFRRIWCTSVLNNRTSVTA
jgi:hypothetical protein